AIFKTLADVPRLPVPQGPAAGGAGSGTAPNILQQDVSPQQGSGPSGSGGAFPGANDAPTPRNGAPGRNEAPDRPDGGAIPLADETRPGSDADPNLGLVPRTVAVLQDNALVAASKAQGLLAAASGAGAPGLRIVAAHVGEAAIDGVPLADGTVVLAGRYGTLVLNQDGTYLYRADRAAALAQGQHGADAFSYRVQDERGTAATATLTVDVTGVNDAPVAAGPVALAPRPASGPWIVTAAELLAGASDIDGDALSITDVRIGSGGGRLVDLGEGRYRYEPAPIPGGPVVLAYTITDGHGGSLAQTAQFTPVPGHAATISGDLSAAVREDAPGTAAGMAVVADADPGEAFFKVPASLEGRYGRFGFDAQTGQWRYALANAAAEVQALSAGESVQDRLGLTSVDGSATSEIVVTVQGSNDAPILSAADPAAFAERPGETGSAASGSVAGTLAFSDVDRHDLHSVAVGSPVATRASGTVPGEAIAALARALTASVSEADGSGRVAFTFTVADRVLDFLKGGERLSVVYPVTLSDGQGGSAQQPVTITLVGANDAPVAEDASVSTRGGRPVTGTLTAKDVDADSLAFSTVTGPAHGSLSLGANGQFTYTPATGFRGTDSFTYRASDGSLDSEPATVTIAVNGGAAPLITSGASASLTLTIGQAGRPLTAIAAGYLAAGNALADGLGGHAGFGETTLDANDDASTQAIDITGVFGPQGLNFFNHRYTAIYVNNNGNITFEAPLGTYTPTRIGGGDANPIIAPFWADVDTSTGPSGTTAGGHSKGSNLVHIDRDTANGVVTITWDDVGYYSNHTDALNAFQLQLIDLGNGDFDIVYRYEAVNWTLGDASEGIHARAGYSSGTDAAYYELPQSGHADALVALPGTPGNTGIDGVYVFEVQNGSVRGAGALQGTGTVGFSDADIGDVHSVAIAIEAGSIHWRRADGSEAGTQPAAVADALARAFSAGITQEGGGTGTATWTLSLPKSEVAFLGVGETLSVVYDLVVRDDAASSAPATVAVTIRSIGGVSIGGDHAVSAAPGGSVVLTESDITALGADPTGGAPTYAVEPGAGGYFTLDGLQTLLPVTSFTEADILAHRVIYHGGPRSEDIGLTLRDAAGHVASARLAITVAEVAKADHVVRAADASGPFALPKEALLFNDAGDRAALKVGGVMSAHGTVTDTDGPALIVAASPAGEDVFVYEARDALHPTSNAAAVSVAISSAPDIALAGRTSAVGSPGDDILIASSNHGTVMTGGAGHDVFVFSAAPSGSGPLHQITDFDATQDAIDLAFLGASGGIQFADLHLNRNASAGYDLAVGQDAASAAKLVHLAANESIQDKIAIVWLDHLAYLPVS
ncbi:Ig-like domain-containing protein, partial [Methylobacterium nigriterrae]|uniref:Ig-like domain-containing protein n=1 Tax=Methylobacterium nigriterrae TaxID=3127512 RepID=UPI0030138FE9